MSPATASRPAAKVAPAPYPPFNRQKACRHGTFLFNVHDTFVGRSLDLYGEWSEGEVELLGQLVRPGQCVVEVGANIGAHTVPLARAVGPAGRVLAFEPQRLVYQTLCANLALNSIPNVVTRQAAVGAAPGELLVPPVDHLRENNFGGLSLEGHQRGERVAVVTLDALELAECHLLKVDVEGMERAVLEGAAATFARCRPILYVDNHRRDRSDALVRTIAALGYTAYWHTPAVFNPRNFAGNAENVFGTIASMNMLCVPQGSPLRVEGLRPVQVPAAPAAAPVAPAPPATTPVAPVTLDAARHAHRSGDVARAVELYEELLRARPADAQVWYLLGVARQGLGRRDEATTALREAVRLAPERAEFHNHLGVVLASAAQMAEAETCFARALELRPDSAETLNNRGGALVELGRPDEALACFDRALALDPHHAETLANRGRLRAARGEDEAARADLEAALRARPDFPRAWQALQQLFEKLGRPDDALAVYRQLAADQPNAAPARLRLARALYDRQNYPEAADVYRQVLKLRPDLPDALDGLALTLRAQGNGVEALALLRRACALAPRSAEVHNNLGLALLDAEQYPEAEGMLREALRLKPDFAAAHNTLSIILRRQNKSAEALTHARRAVELHPDGPESHNNLGLALLDANQIDEGAASLREALRLRPTFYQAHNNLGIAHWRRARMDDAVACYEEALRLKPDFAEAYNNLGNAQRDRLQLDAALASFARALELKPDYVDPHWNRSLTWLIQGNLKEGWPEYEWRWKLKTFSGRRPLQPRWDGSDLAGRTILVHPEQGLGDSIQFLRYLPMVQARGGRVVFECPKALRRLCAGLKGVDQLVPQGTPLPPFDVHVPLMSLPLVFGTELDTIPAPVPYLHPDPALLERWRGEAARWAGFTIGIAWQGSTSYRMDHLRSIPLRHFAPLAKLPGVRLISLQKGHGSEQVRQVDFPVIDLSGRLDEEAGPFMDTAALMKAVDLVITSDTAVAHLAGALGAAVWMATPYSPDWRWLLGRDDCPWYPTMRLFRQERPGEWEPVFARMARAL